MTTLAVDIGGTKLAAGLVTSGRLTSRSERPTPPGGSSEELWEALLAVIDDVSGNATVDAVGVGCGGPMTWPEGRVSPLNIPGWRDFPLRQRLSDRYAARPVVVHNDAVAFVLGEHSMGAAQQWGSVLGIVVSTGVGGGLLLDGRVRNGPTGNAGHLGHVVVDPRGPSCACGGRGCVEAIARGPAVAAWAVEHGWRPAAPPTAKLLAESARDADPVALAAFERAGRAVGLGIASAAALLDLDGVVIGGGLAAAGDLLLGPIRAELASYARLPFTDQLPVVAGTLGRDAGLLGAAALATAGG